MNNQNKGEAMEAKVIKTWAERIAHHPDRDAAEHIDEAKDAEIADLRAALASAQEEIAGLRKDAERFQWIEENARTKGGGHGFTLTCYVNFDHEDIGSAIDAMIEREAQP